MYRRGRAGHLGAIGELKGKPNATHTSLAGPHGAVDSSSPAVPPGFEGKAAVGHASGPRREGPAAKRHSQGPGGPEVISARGHAGALGSPGSEGRAREVADGGRTSWLDSPSSQAGVTSNGLVATKTRAAKTRAHGRDERQDTSGSDPTAALYEQAAKDRYARQMQRGSGLDRNVRVLMLHAIPAGRFARSRSRRARTVRSSSTS